MTTGEQAARVRSRGRRAGLLALAVTFSAGMHAALVPEHLKEMPPLGWSFIGAAIIGAGLAYLLICRPEDRLPARLAALFLAAEIVAWAVFVTVRVPGFMGTPEAIETIALVCKAVELFGLALAIWIGWPDRVAAWTGSAQSLLQPAP
jgi:drug/metabolite transporter (DMT)-like permease